MRLTLSSVFASIAGPANPLQVKNIHTDRIIMSGGDMPERHLWATAEQTENGKWHVFGHKVYDTAPNDIKPAPEKHRLTKQPIKLDNAIARMKRFVSEQMQKGSPTLGLTVRRGFFPPTGLEKSTHISRVEKSLSTHGKPNFPSRDKKPKSNPLS